MLNGKLLMLENADESSCDSVISEFSSQDEELREDDDDHKPLHKDIEQKNCNKCLYKDWQLVTHKVKISVFNELQ